MGFGDNIDICGTGLYLGLGFSSTANQRSRKPQGKGASLSFESSLTSGLSNDQIYDQKAVNHKVNISRASSKDIQYADLSCSYSHVSVKRETDVCTNYYKETDADDDGSNGRKKLRLTKIQSALLEESFKQHSSLNPKQKQKLARELNVRPRQVEVWFQNRRARTKLKQTEVDCEFLKKYCETLTDENRKLYKELQELRKALKLAPQPLYMQRPTATATLTMCPSCERVVGNALPS